MITATTPLCYYYIFIYQFYLFFFMENSSLKGSLFIIF